MEWQHGMNSEVGWKSECRTLCFFPLKFCTFALIGPRASLCPCGANFWEPWTLNEWAFRDNLSMSDLEDIVMYIHIYISIYYIYNVYTLHMCIYIYIGICKVYIYIMYIHIQLWAWLNSVFFYHLHSPGSHQHPLFGAMFSFTSSEISVERRRLYRRRRSRSRGEIYSWKYGENCGYPLVNCHIAMERSTIFHGKIHYFYGHFQ